MERHQVEAAGFGVAAVAGLIGAVGLLGLLIEQPEIAALGLSTPIRAAGALALTLGAISALSLSRGRRLPAVVSGLGVSLVGAATLWRPDLSPVIEAPWPSPMTGLALLALGLALVARPLRLHETLRCGALAAAAVAGFLGLMRALNNVDGPQPIATWSWITPPMAIGLFSLAVGVALMTPRGHLHRVLTSPYLDGTMGRRVFPVLLVLAFGLLSLRILGHRAGLFDAELGLSLVLTIGVGALSVTFFFTADALARPDRDRVEALNLLNQVQSLTHLGLWRLDMATGRLQRPTSHCPSRDTLRALNQETLEGLVAAAEPEDRAAFADLIDACRQDTVPREATLRFCSESGPPLEFTVRAHGVPGAGAEIQHVIVLMLDVTERRRMERALDEREKRLVISERMASLGTMSAGVAHEINNPLTYLTGNLSLLTEDLVPRINELCDGDVGASTTPMKSLKGISEEASELLAECQEAADRVRLIVREMLSFARGNDDPNELTDLREVADFTLRMASKHLRHRARVRMELGETPLIRAGRSRLGQVLLNLLMNAAQAIPEGTQKTNEVWLTTGRHPNDGRAFVEVGDTGGGIAPPDLPRIFDPFFTTRSDGAGTGLGLSICHNIVASLGGELTVESTLGVGTTFRVFLPAASPDTREVIAPIPTERPEAVEPGPDAHLAV